MGDYASGTNHVLPTYGYARMYSGVSLDSFQKKMTVQARHTEQMHALCSSSASRVMHHERTSVPLMVHVLAALCQARMQSILSNSFIICHAVPTQTLTPEGLRNLGPSVERMAAVEGLDAHKRAVSLRLAALSR